MEAGKLGFPAVTGWLLSRGVGKTIKACHAAVHMHPACVSTITFSSTGHRADMTRVARLLNTCLLAVRRGMH